VLTTSGAYPWLFATQIFHNGQPSHDDINLTKRNIGLVSSLLAAALYHEILIVTISTRMSYILRGIYTPYAGAAGLLLHINGKFTMGKLKSSLLS
jgi:hypothetical protein